MGLIYYLVDRGSRRAFRLGKGRWRDVVVDGSFSALRTSVYAALANMDDPDREQSADALSVDLWAFARSCSDLELRSDAEDYDDEWSLIDGRWVNNLLLVGSLFGGGQDLKEDPLSAITAAFRASARAMLASEVTPPTTGEQRR